MLNRAIENILRNAVRYTGEERRGEDKKIKITASPKNDLVTIKISDDGPGVSEEELDQIFEVFYRSTPKKKNTPGYGLGLSIAKQAIHLHHGKIHACNKPEGGLEMTIILNKKL